MTCCRRMPRLSAILAGIGVLMLLASPALAQSSMPREWIVADVLNQEQRDGINSFVTDWCTQLKEGDGTAVTTARRELGGPLSSLQDAGDAFVDLYVPRVTTCIEEGLASDRLIVQLNAMILTRRLPADRASALIASGLQAESPAVRYWAVKTVRHIAVRDGWSRQQQRALLAQLSQHLRGERASEVVQQIMLAILSLPLQEAQQQIIEALNRRVAMRVREPGSSIEAERAGLTQLWQQLAGSDPQDERQARHSLARTAYRYMRFAALQLQNNQVPAQRRGNYKNLILLADTVLRSIHGDSGSTLNPPQPKPEGPVRTEDWNLVLVIVDRWESILKAEPFNFTDDELTLEPPQDSAAGAGGDGEAGDEAPRAGE